MAETSVLRVRSLARIGIPMLAALAGAILWVGTVQAAEDPDLIFRKSTVFRWVSPNDKLATYGLRRTMTYDDREDLAAVAKASRAKDYRLRDLLEAFVLSDLFQKR